MGGSELYITFIRHWIVFIFGRDEEEDQVFLVQERQFSLSLLFKKKNPLIMLLGVFLIYIYSQAKTYFLGLCKGQSLYFSQKMKGVYFKRKEFAPLGANSFLFK